MYKKKQHFETHADFFRAVMQAQWGEDGGRIRLVGNAGCELELGFQLDALVGEKSPYTKHCAIVVSHNSLEIAYVLRDYIASGSVRAPLWWTSKLMRLHVLCDIRRSICGVMMRKESSTALRYSSLVV